MIQTDSYIVQQSKQGNKDAFRTLVMQYQHMVYSLSLKMLCNEEDAKDIVQESFIKIWLNIRNFDESKSFSTWVYTIATRLCLDKLKSRKHIVPLLDDEQAIRLPDSNSDIHLDVENREWITLIRAITAELSPKQRLVFTLCQLEELSSDEAERITGMNATQIKSNLYLARQNVINKLKALGYE